MYENQQRVKVFINNKHTNSEQQGSGFPCFRNSVF